MEKSEEEIRREAEMAINRNDKKYPFCLITKETESIFSRDCFFPEPNYTLTTYKFFGIPIFLNRKKLIRYNVNHG